MTTSSRGTNQALVQTKDIGLVAFLTFSGLTPVRTIWEDYRCRWVFERELIGDLIDRYRADECSVNPREFFHHLSNFRKKIHEERMAHNEEVGDHPEWTKTKQ